MAGVSKPAPKPLTASHAAALDDDDDMPYDIQPLRRTSTSTSPQAVPSSAVPATLFVGLGIGAACSVLLAVVIMLVLQQPSEKPTRLAERQTTAAPADSDR
jgi:hypothetical protein